MERQNERVEPTEIYALSIFCATLAARCKALLRRLATPETLAAEIAQFRDDALRDLEEGTVEGLAVDDKAEALRRARDHIDKLCASFLEGDSSGPKAKPSVH